MTLIATFLITGCTAQDPEVSEEPPAPSSAAATPTVTAEVISGSFTGDHTFELGVPPAEATHIKVELTCVDPGILFLPREARMECADQSAQTTTSITSIPLSPGQESVEVRTSEAEVSYKATMSYESK